MQFSKDSALNFYKRQKIRRLADDYSKQTFATFHPPIELNSNRIVGLVYSNNKAVVK